MNTEQTAAGLRHLILLAASGQPGAAGEAEQTARDPDYASFHPVVVRVKEKAALPAVEDTLRQETGSAETEGLLILCDSPDLAATLAAAGWPVAGWLPAGGQRQTFRAVTYVLSDITELEPDTYEKVYERTAGLPWTILTTPRCRVREMTLADLPGLYRLYDDPAARQYLEGPDPDPEQEKARLSAYIHKVYGLYGYGYWAVVDPGSGELVGRVGFEPYQAGAAAVSFGYLIRADRRRQGLAEEVCRAVLDYAQRNLGFPGICAETAPGNTASRKLLLRLGFQEIRPGQWVL